LNPGGPGKRATKNLEQKGEGGGVKGAAGEGKKRDEERSECNDNFSCYSRELKVVRMWRGTGKEGVGGHELATS